MLNINMLDSWLAEGESYERKSHYASDATACRRQLWYKWNGVAKSDPPTAGALLKMKMGVAAEVIYERFLQAKLEEGAIKSYDTQYAHREKIKGLTHPLSMKLDFLIDDEYFIELKSSYGAGIKRIQQSQQPKSEHLMQCFLYLSFIKPEGVLVYVGRDNGYRTDFDLSLHDDGVLVNGNLHRLSFDEVLSKFIEIESFVNDNSCPPRDYVVAIKNGEVKDKFQKSNVVYKSDWQCSYCDWLHRCWEPDIHGYRQGDNSQMFEIRVSS